MFTNRALYLDRDGVINLDKHHLYKVEECEFVPGIFDLCKYANQKGYRVIVVTNQAGIAKGYYALEEMEKLHDYMLEEFSKRSIVIDRFYHCPHHPDFTGECNCRKPAPGMILQAAEDFRLNLKNSILIGDKPSDIEAGERAGVGTCYLLNERCGQPHKNYENYKTLEDILQIMKFKEDSENA